jgi:hypothetical protein
MGTEAYANTSASIGKPNAVSRVARRALKIAEYLIPVSSDYLLSAVDFIRNNYSSDRSVMYTETRPVTPETEAVPAAAPPRLVQQSAGEKIADLKEAAKTRKSCESMMKGLSGECALLSLLSSVPGGNPALSNLLRGIRAESRGVIHDQTKLAEKV